MLLLTLLAAEITARMVGETVPEPLRWYDAVAQQKVAQMDELGHADIVFAGTSMAWQAFVPQVFEEPGVNAYNAGLNGGVPGVMQRWLLEEVQPRLNPKLVVWGLSSLDLAPNYGDLNIAAYHDALETRPGLLARVEREAADRFSLVGLRPLLRDPAELWGRAAEDRERGGSLATALLGPAGERRGWDRDVGARRKAIQQSRLEGYSPSEVDANAIVETVAELKRRGVEVALVELPVPDRFVALHPDGSLGHRKTGQEIENLARALDVRFLRMVEGYGNSDFVDFTHLNQVKANKLSEEVAVALASDRDDRGAPIRPLDVGDNQPAAPIDSDCSVRIVEDEYGFEAGIRVCAGDEPPAGTRDSASADSPPLEIDPDVAVWLGSSDAVEVSVRIRDRLVGQTGCGSPGSAPALDIDVPEMIKSVVDKLDTALEAMEVACADGDASWIDALESATAVAIELGAAAGAASSPSTEYKTDHLTERTALAIAVVDHVFAVLTDRTSGLRANSSTQFYYSADEVGLARGLRQSEPPQLAIIGDSISAFAFDQNAIAAALKKPTINASLAAADPEEWSTLLPRLFVDEPPPELIWPVTTHRLLLRTTHDCRALVDTRTARSEALRDMAFSSPPTTADLSFDELVSSPSGSGRYEGTIADATYADRWDAPGMRTARKGTFEGAVAQTEVTVRYEPPVRCPARLDAMVEAIKTFQAAGSSVTIVLVPNTRAVTELAPLDHAELAEQVRAVAALTRTTLVELPGPLEDSETFDGWHPNIRGRDRLTESLISLLTE